MASPVTALLVAHCECATRRGNCAPTVQDHMGSCVRALDLCITCLANVSRRHLVPLLRSIALDADIMNARYVLVFRCFHLLFTNDYIVV